MLYLLTAINKILQTYLQALKKDLANIGVESIVLITSISWIGIPILIGLMILGNFSMPTDFMFYVFWLGVALISTLQFILFVSGLVKSGFYAANAVSHISFVFTVLYALLFLNESISGNQIIAIIIAVIGALLFFESKKGLLNYNNQGLLLILFSLFTTPFAVIFYKLAINHTDSFAQFLTGRFLMDALYYTLFFLIMFLAWYKKNPVPIIRSYLTSVSGVSFMVLSAISNLADAWLLYKLPVVLFTVLGTIVIPTSYVIGKSKYRERTSNKFIAGGILIIIGIILYVIT